MSEEIASQQQETQAAEPTIEEQIVENQEAIHCLIRLEAMSDFIDYILKHHKEKVIG